MRTMHLMKLGTDRVQHVLFRGGPPKAAWNIPRRQVEDGLAAGYMTLDGDTLTIRTQAGDPDVRYRVNRSPGYYCKSTGQQISVSPMAWARMLTTGKGDLSAQEAKAWLASNGKAADDYEVVMAYECTLIEGA